MKKSSLQMLILLCTASLFFAACNSNDPIKEAEKVNKQTKDSSMIPAVSPDDVHFAAEATSGGMMEVQLGTLARGSANKTVRDFGEIMVNDHTKANKVLKTIAAGKGITLPDSMSFDDQRMVSAIATKKGAEFDKAYISMMVKDHHEDIDHFKKEAQQGADEALKTFASNTLPVLEKHLTAAQAAEKVVSAK